MNVIPLNCGKNRITNFQRRNDLYDIQLIIRLLVILLFLLCCPSQGALGQTVSLPVEKSAEPTLSTTRVNEIYSGTLRIGGGNKVTFITAAKIFHLEGPIVPHLLKEHDKQWRIEGRVTDGGTLEATYAAPIKRVEPK